MRWLATDIAAAFGLFTRLPVGWALRAGTTINPARGVWAYPVAGAAIGGAAAAVHHVAMLLGMPPALAACWTLAALLLLTGALHEDGLADTADGFGGGGTRQRKLEIMRDSRIGSYGALALILSVAIRGAAIAALAEAGPALVAAATLGRAGLLLPLLALRPARPDGLASALAAIPFPSLAAASAIAIALAAALLPAGAALLAIGLALAGGAAMTWLAHRQVGGHTGDLLGATELVIECLVLTALVL